MKSIFVALVLALSTSSAWAQGCPNISGTWTRSDGSQTQTFQQTGCSISASYTNPNYGHSTKGEWRGNHFEIATLRTTLKNDGGPGDPYGCTVTLYGRITNIQPSLKATFHLDRTSGGCLLPTGLTEQSDFLKR